MFENLFEKKTSIEKPKTGQKFEGLFELPIESRETKIERLKIEAEESKKIAEEMAKPMALAEETKERTWNVLKGISKTIGGIAKQTPHYISEAAKNPYQTAIGVMETGVLKPTIAATKLLLPKKLEEKIIPKMEAGLETIEELMPSEEARTVGNLAGWLLPYTTTAKVAIKGMEVVNIATKLGKHAKGVADAFGFLGTGQLLFDSKTESSRARKAIQDLAILAGFRIGGYVLKGAFQMAGKKVEQIVMPIITRMKSGKKVPLKEVEKAVSNARAITKGITKKKPEQIIEKEIIPRAKKIKVSPQKELATLKEINREIPGIKGIENRIKEIEIKLKVKPIPLKPLALVGGKPVAPVVKPAISKELEPLAKEARKYKSAEEFRKAIETLKVRKKISLPSETIIKGYPDYIALRGKLVKEGFGKEKELFTNFYAQATKAVKEVKPVIKPTKLPVELKGKPSKVALSIEAKAIEKDLTKGFKDLAEYTPTTIKEQAKKMAVLMKDIEKAKRVAMGIEPLPEGLNGATVITTMEKYALKTKNGELMAELAKSPLVSETSMAGQTLRMTAEREPESAVRKIQEIIKARKEGIEKKLKWKKPEQIKSGIKKSLEKEIKKTKPNKYSWEKLITEITC